MPDLIGSPKSKRGGKRQGAGRKPNTQSEDLEAFREALRLVNINREHYTPLDRYRDARLVFGTDAGKRVYSLIMDLCDGPLTYEYEAESAGKLAYRAGMKYIGINIISWLKQPRAVPRDELK